MKNIRFQRLEHELEQRLQARQGVFKDALLALLNHPQNVAHIRLGDIALIPEVREVMCSPADVTVTKDSFDAAAAQMQKHSKEFQRRVQDELLGLLSKLVKEDAKSDADPKAAALQDEKLSGAKVLGLATTCFLCTKCGRGQFYPSVLKHACLRKQPPIVETSDIYGQFVARTIPLYWSGELPVKVMGVLKACEPHACVAKAFELCGKDSRTVTMKEMDALPDLRFVVGERTVLTWRAVVGPTPSFAARYADLLVQLGSGHVQVVAFQRSRSCLAPCYTRRSSRSEEGGASGAIEGQQVHVQALRQFEGSSLGSSNLSSHHNVSPIEHMRET